jgi:ribosomal protein L21E
MPKRPHGKQQGCRNKLLRKPRDKGKVSIVKQLKSFEIGDSVMVKIEPMIRRILFIEGF